MSGVLRHGVPRLAHAALRGTVSYESMELEPHQSMMEDVWSPNTGHARSLSKNRLEKRRIVNAVSRKPFRIAMGRIRDSERASCRSSATWTRRERKQSANATGAETSRGAMGRTTDRDFDPRYFLALTQIFDGSAASDCCRRFDMGNEGVEKGLPSLKRLVELVTEQIDQEHVVPRIDGAA